MKRNCLYTVNPWNTNIFACGGNKHAFGDFLKPVINGAENQGYMGNWLGADKMSKGAGAMVGALGTAVGGLGSKLIGGGYDAAGVGNGITTIGGTIGGAVSQVNPLVGGIISAGSGIIGGGINRLWGMKTDQEALNRANSDIAAMRSFTSNANSFDNIEAPAAVGAVGNVYKGGVFKKGTARRKNQALQNDLNNAVAFANNSVANNIENLQADQFNNLLANYAAFGGYFGMPQATGALGIMQTDKYINAINNRSNAIAKANTFNQAPTSFSPLGNAFADGGGIHIKPSHKGLFTEKANRAGMGVQAYASHVLANKEDYPSSTVKQANFAKNAAGWKHDAGGSLEAAFLDNFSSDPLEAVMQYNRGLEAMAAQREAEEAAAAQQAAYDDMQKRVLAAETQSQGLQSMLDSQGLTIQALMDAQRQNNYAEGWKERMGMENDLATPLDSAVMARMRKSLEDRGITKRTYQDAVIANMMVESGGNPNAKNANSSARGLMQWTTPRHPKAWDWDSQVDHIVNTLESGFGDKKALERFRNTNDSAEAARIFRQYWERPEKHTYNWTDKWINKMYGDKKAFGGELGTNGTDFTNGLLEINTGGTHEENPYEGVQIGLDPQGIPNLVEEGETVYNDYVYSKRMNVPTFMKKQLGLGGDKDEITFAEASKKIAEASKERPNNPMDQDYLADALGKLAQVQEAERMRMQAEEANAEMEAIAPLIAACGGKLRGFGGNLFAGGGALEWLKENHPELKNKEAIAKVMEVRGNRNKSSYYHPDVSMFGKKNEPRWHWDVIFGSMKSPLTGGSKRVFDSLRADGLDKNVAFELAYPESGLRSYSGENYTNAKAKRDATYKEWTSPSKVQQKKAAVAPQETPAANNAVKWGKSQNGLQTRINPDGSVWYKSPNNGNYYRTEQIALNAGKPVTKKNSAEIPTQKPAATQSIAAANSRPNSRINNRNVAPNPVRATMNDSGIIAPSDTIENGTYNLNNFDWLNNPQYQAGNQGIPFSRNASPEEIAAIEASKPYTDWTDYVVENWSNPKVQEYLKALDAKTGGAGNLLGDNVNAAQQYFRGARNDGRWGYYHLTPEMLAAAQAANAENVNYDGEGDVDDFVEVDANGNPTGVVSDAAAAGPFPEDATNFGSPEAMEAAQNYGAASENNAIGNPEYNPPKYNTWMRYAPAVGAGIMTLTDALGLTNRPDYTYANKLEAAAERAGYAPNVKFNPIGDYMTYRPLDRLFYANQLQANARATDRALANTSGGNRGTAQAAMLANGYNTNNNLGNLYRQAEEYNLAQRERVADFNRKTNMFNSQMGLEADTANARYRQLASHASLQGLAQAAAMRDAIDQRVGAARTANLTNLLTSLGNIGRENFALNQIRSDKAYGYAPTSTGWSEWKGALGGEMEKSKKNKKQGRRNK